MSRPKSDEKRAAIMAAAIRVFAAQGLAAPTAAIAKAAGVANGSLFNYFETKTDLFNALYVELKGEVVAAAMGGLPDDAELKAQVFHMWSGWMRWGAAFPDKRKTLALLGVCDGITPASTQATQNSAGEIACVLEQIRASGPFRDQPMSFLVAILEAISGATIDFMIQHPEAAEQHCQAGFDALWRAVT